MGGGASLGRIRISPQQAIVLSVVSPQVKPTPPALTKEKVPAGAVAWPTPLAPHQATVPSVCTPQVCIPPALTEAKVPAGGVAWS